jgi:hypothetical protein
MLLDFDPAVVAIASQAFWLSWVTEDRKRRSHVPDYFARNDTPLPSTWNIDRSDEDATEAAK